MILNFQGGRMVKWKGRAASMAPSALSISVVALVAAGVAQAQDIVIDGEESSTVVIDGTTDSLTINGSINLSGSSETAIFAVGPEIPTAVINNGSISVTGDTDRNTGFVGYGTLTGSITNNGPMTIETNATSDDDYAAAGGILVYGDVADGASISNANAISATVNISAADLFPEMFQFVGAGGIVAEGGVLGSVENTGDITVNLNVTGADSDYQDSGAVGISVESIGQNGAQYGASLNNEGAIRITTTVSGESSPNIYNSVAGIAADNLYGDGSLTNSGDIIISQTLSGDTRTEEVVYGPYTVGPYTYGPYYYAYTGTKSAEAVGITAFDIEEDATLDNGGNITVTQQLSGASNNARAQASGIFVENIENASAYDPADSGGLTNSGDIVISQTLADDAEVLDTAYGAYNSRKDAEAYGIRTSDIRNYGSLNNSGSITVTQELLGEVTRAEADAYGIYTDNIYDYGSFTNSGDIVVSQTISGEGQGVYTGYGYIDVRRQSADAYGIRTDDVEDNATFTNSGDIAVTQQLSGSGNSFIADAYGIYVDNVENYGRFENTGDILVSQTISGDAKNFYSYGYLNRGGIFADGYGIKTDDIEDNSTFSNIGNITVIQEISGTAGFSGGEVYGIEFDIIENESRVTNNGDIVVSQSISVSGEGLGFEGYYSYIGTFINAEAYGIKTDDIENDATFTNGGDITVSTAMSGSATYMNVEAYGLAGDVIEQYGDFSNSGDITVIASATGSGDYTMYVSATGLYFDRIYSDGTATNTGDIVAIADASNSSTDAYAITMAKAVAVDIVDLYGSFSNAGSLIARSDSGEAYAMRIFGNNPDSEVTITANGVIEGRLTLDVGNLTVVSTEDTGSIYWTFENLDAEIESMDTVLTLNDADGPALVRIGDVIATVSGPSTESQSADSEMIAQAVMLGSDKALSMLRTGGDDIATRMHSDGNGRGITAFADINYVSRTHDAFEFDITSVTGGAMGTLSNGFDYAITATGFSAEGEVTTALGASDASSSGFSLGAYSRADLGAVSLSFGATFGTATNESERLVNDNSVLGGVSTLDGEFGTTFISPAVEVSYATQMAGMAVTPRAGFRYTFMTAEAYTETGGAAAIAVDERTMNVSDFTVGVETSQAMRSGVLTASADVLMRSISGDDFDVALAGVSGATAGASDDFTAIDFGIGYEMGFGDGIISLGASGMVGDVEGYGISARYEISF